MILEINNLSKKFGPNIALQSVSLKVDSKESLLIAGPNGSGKSTLFKIICGLIKYPGDDVKILGMDPWKERHKLFRRIAAYFEDYSFPDFASAHEYLAFIARVRGYDANFAEHVREMFRISEFWDRQIRSYSSGMKRKIALAQLFIGEPELLILDEPFVALERSSRYQLIEKLKEKHESGKTVMIAAHEFTGLHGLVERLVVMMSGRIIMDRKVQEGERLEQLYTEALSKG